MNSSLPHAEQRERLERAVQHEIDRRILQTIQPLASLFAGLYAIYTVAHLLLQKPALQLVLVPLASATCLCCSALALRVRRRPPRAEHAHALETLLASVALINSGVHLVLSRDPMQTTNLALVQMAAGFLFLSWLWYGVVTAVGAGFFVLAFHQSAGGQSWNHYLFMLVSATASSAVIHAIHLAAVRRADRERLRSDWQIQARLAQLETIAHLGHLAATELEPQSLIDTAVAAVESTLDASSVALEQQGKGVRAQVGAPRPTPAHQERIDASGDDAFGVTLVVQFERAPDFSVAPFLRSVTQLIAMNLRRTALEQRRLETERALLQAQRMESIALLAGGLAHDFNNLLTVVLGHVGLIRHRRGPNAGETEPLDQIVAAVNAAARLTHQLLAFGRRQPMRTEVFDLRELVTQLQNMLRRTINESIELQAALTDEPCLIRADRTHIEQVLMNLVVNARDAVNRDGRIQIQIELTELGSHQLRGGRHLPAGPYVVLSVRDDGNGIESDALPHIFEPFFTTKGIERGTGLGLATVHGIVHQSGGTITVSSTPGQGAVFEVYLPRQSEAELPGAAPSQSTFRMVPVQTATILVVEDNEAVRAFVVAALRDFGYEVIDAASGLDAIALSRQREAPIELLLSDVVMPSMSGPEVADRLVRERPELRVLFMSGYTADHFEAGDMPAAESRHNLLTKPFTANALRRSPGRADEHPSQYARALGRLNG